MKGGEILKKKTWLLVIIAVATAILAFGAVLAENISV